MKGKASKSTDPGSHKRRSAVLEARPGIEKAAQRQSKIAGGQRKAILPKVGRKPLKMIVDDATVARAQGRAVSPIVSRKPQ
jgi:hypothetical protein